MNDAKKVLLELGYDEVRSRSGDWTPTASLNGELGTTDDTHIYVFDDEPAELVDPENGEVCGFARQS